MPLSNNPGTDPVKNPNFVTLDGADATGVTQAAGATGARGWLSSIFSVLSAGLTVVVRDATTAVKKLLVTTSGAALTVPAGYSKRVIAKAAAVQNYTVLAGPGYLGKIWNASQSDLSSACTLSIYDSTNATTPGVDPFMKSFTLTGGQILEFDCALDSGLIIAVEGAPLNSDGGIYATIAAV